MSGANALIILVETFGYSTKDAVNLIAEVSKSELKKALQLGMNKVLKKVDKSERAKTQANLEKAMALVLTWV